MELRVQVRGYEDGFTRAVLELDSAKEPFLLAVVASPAYEESEEVRGAFYELVKSVVASIAREHLDGQVSGVEVVAPGAPIGSSH